MLGLGRRDQGRPVLKFHSSVLLLGCRTESCDRAALWSYSCLIILQDSMVNRGTEKSNRFALLSPGYVVALDCAGFLHELQEGSRLEGQKAVHTYSSSSLPNHVCGISPVQKLAAGLHPHGPYGKDHERCSPAPRDTSSCF